MTNARHGQLRSSLGPTLRAYLELVRAPNLFTAVADVAMGLLFVRAIAAPADGGLLGWSDVWPLGLLVLGSTALYASGVVLNDVFDLPVDARQRPERPLPSGRVSLGAARRLGWSLLLAGVVLTWVCAPVVGSCRPGVVGSLLAACIVLYDGLLKRTPLGPPLMGSCRTLNVLLGMSVATAAWQAEHWLVAGGIGVYITGVTWLARTEAGRSSRLQLGLATTLIALGIVLLGVFPSWAENLAPLLVSRPAQWGLLMLVLAAPIALLTAAAVVDPFPTQVQAAVRLCILWLVVLDAAVCCAVAGPVWAVMILLLLLPAALLARWIGVT